MHFFHVNALDDVHAACVCMCVCACVCVCVRVCCVLCACGHAVSMHVLPSDPHTAGERGACHVLVRADSAKCHHVDAIKLRESIKPRQGSYQTKAGKPLVGQVLDAGGCELTDAGWTCADAG